MTVIASLYIETLHRDEPERRAPGMRVCDLEQLCHGMVDADIHSPSVVDLIRGRLSHVESDPAVILCLGDTRHETLARWTLLAESAYATMLAASSADIGEPKHLQKSDVSLLTGHGIVLASRGHPREALTDLSVRQLEHSLDEERAILADYAGYLPRFLFPRKPVVGSNIDRLVLEQAHRAGFRWALHRSTSVFELDNHPAHKARHSCLGLPTRFVTTDDEPDELLDWIVGRRFARQTARVKKWVGTSRQIFSRWLD